MGPSQERFQEVRRLKCPLCRGNLHVLKHQTAFWLEREWDNLGPIELSGQTALCARLWVLDTDEFADLTHWSCICSSE